MVDRIFEQQIVIDIKAGSPADIAIFPQPGLAANMAAIGGLKPLIVMLSKLYLIIMPLVNLGWI